MQTVDYVDLNRFMGDWYVIAIIPNFVEKDAVNGIESYSLREDGDVDIEYTFSRGELGKKVKRMTARAFIHDRKSNAEWRVRFFWPVKFPYLVIDLDDEYNYTAIGVPNRKYLWIMARTSSISDETYEAILERLQGKGYDIEKIRKMPQRWDMGSK
ncbi:MAG: lipocalin family protein [Candidatus Cloacimonetes bacterium]|nr:lipocalin family protein [Candidatus Cloacimonadota bacterium]